VRFEFGILAALTVGLAAGPALAQSAASPPIFQPGAPGAPSRVITPDQAVNLSRSTFTDDDVLFMQHMIVHHGQAVEMVELLKTRGADPQIGLLGQRIALSQEAEMTLMRGWLAARGEDETMPADMHAGHGGMDHAAHAAPGDTAVMPGMLTPNQMQALAAASGPEFDRLFLTGMIQHHQGALDMVDVLMAEPDSAEDSMLSEFVTSVVADQSAEILRMQSLSSAF